MAKKTSRRYVVVLVIGGVLIAGLGVLGMLDLRPVAHEANVTISTGSLAE